MSDTAAAPSLRAALSALDNGGAAEEAAALLASPAFAAAREAIVADHDRIVADIIRLTEIASPPFGEAPARRPSPRRCASMA
ncbi:hypothetical protein ACFQU7_09385 [Pseudoroseomonas wenyumeiae]